MLELERIEFRRMLTVSTAVHILILGTLLGLTSLPGQKLLDLSVSGPMSVMWARTVSVPAETAPNKLPGPIVALPAEEANPPEPKYVLPEDPALREAVRKAAMREAIADVRQALDGRPIPRADNFPSLGPKKGEEEGLPAGPGGLGGILGGDPAFTGYRNQIRQRIVNAFIWLRPNATLRAEVTFTIDAEGNVLNPSVSRPSGDAAFDAAALRAVRKSSPLPPPPEELASSLVNERFFLNFDPGMR